jgi:hypothetical protein
MRAARISAHIAETVPSKSNTTTVVTIVVVVVLLAAAAGAAIILLRRKRAAALRAAGSHVDTTDHPSAVHVEDTTSATDGASPSIAMTPPASSRSSTNMTVFLSYRREDSADVAGRIYDRLALAFGQDQVFKDVDSIPLGVDFREHLQQVVGRCDVLLAVIGDQWLVAAKADEGLRLNDPKDFVRIELESALQRGIPVIPVLVRGAAVPGEAELPASLGTLAYRSGIAVRADPDFHRDMDRLIDGVRHHVKGG